METKRNDAWVVAGEYSDAPRAFIVAGMLRNNGIPAVVETDTMATLYAGGSTWAPIRLFVPPEMAANARALIDEHEDM